ncbi:hypothetical protein PC129_g22620 [Phytophthora cactorum]|uniref:Uncharacterized protein n=1 Tax=Phytophthora cactorum TaxID=29920 RepID=A0A329RFF2_9STRA|nr:hypothetical protein Pcac1_g17665 [Phytophthora cactorum]KAG2794516.1 hypothetical protein PC112_g23013 [Phytophthora cactorum]KAG2802314.1 hypothetical protein PC111_g19152 [Phytophthora cactorum]KAG2818116.1 hypothetical protein PC113_g22896 [Phytophthora cactorum]KAG2873770.1 hypothetical protein PC114_g25672 [Phytophthora cactorum]
MEEAGNGCEQDKSRATEARREVGAGSPDDSAEVLGPEPELGGDCPVEATSTERGVAGEVVWTVAPDTVVDAVSTAVETIASGAELAGQVESLVEGISNS